MKRTLIRLISVGEVGQLEVEGIEMEIHQSSIFRTGVKVFIIGKSRNPDEEIEKLNQSEDILVPKDSTAYEIANKVELDGDAIYAVIFYKGIKWEIKLDSTSMR